MTGRVPLLAVVAVLALFAGITGVRLAYTLAYALFLLVVVAWVWSRVLASSLEVRRQPPAGAHMVGEAFTETFTVHNRSLLILPHCEIYDRTPLPGYAPGRACALSPRGSTTWTTHGVFSLRGKHTFGPLDVRLGDPFGLFPRTLRLPETGAVTVYPAIRPVGDFPGPTWLGGALGDTNRGRVLDVAPEVSSVRDYASSDGLNRIHWPSTARTGRLISRLYESQQSSDLLILLDLGRGIHVGEPPESTLEYAISLVASISHAALARGQGVGLVASDRRGTTIGVGHGDTQRMRILDFLATAQDTGRQPIATIIAKHGRGSRGRGGLVVVTSDRDHAWVESLVEVGMRGQRHLAVLVEPTSFGAAGPVMRVPAAWRLSLDWWVVRRGDAFSATPRRRLASVGGRG